MKEWIHVILSWLAVGAVGVIHLISDNSAFLTGTAAILASLFTLWQWYKAAKKEKKKRHNRYE